MREADDVCLFSSRATNMPNSVSEAVDAVLARNATLAAQCDRPKILAALEAAGAADVETLGAMLQCSFVRTELTATLKNEGAAPLAFIA